MLIGACNPTAWPMHGFRSCTGAQGQQCLPSIKAVGNDVEVRACCGTVTHHSAACTVDPCETQRQLDEIKRLFGLV